jgi:putative tricarboxylic transport membrane protein
MQSEKLTAIGLFLFSVVYTAGGWHLKIGTLGKPGPGLLPLLVGTGLIACTVIYIFQAWRRKPEPEPSSSSTVTFKTAAWVMAAILVYPILLDQLNFILATSIALYPMFLVLNSKHAFWGAFMTLAIVAVCFIVFGVFLAVTLPSGPIEEFLFRLKG